MPLTALQQASANSIGAVSISEDGIILSVDRLAENLFGYVEADLLGKNVSQLMPEPYKSAHDGFLSKYLATDAAKIIGTGREVVGMRSDGTEFPMWLSVSELRIQGQRVFVGSMRDLTAEKAASKQLAYSLEVTRGLLTTAINPILVVDRKGVIELANPSTHTLLGYEEGELVGQNVRILMPEPYRGEHDSYIQRNIETGENRIIGTGRALEAVRKDGVPVPIYLSLGRMNLDDEIKFVGILTDFTEIKAVEAELRAHQNNLEQMVSDRTSEIEAILQTAINGVISIDGEGRIHLFNPAAEALFGWTEAEVKGRNVSMLMTAKDSNQHDDYLSNFFATGQKNMVGKPREVLAARKDGSTFPAYLAVGHRHLSNGEHLFVAFVNDITEQKLAEQELMQAKDAAELGARTKASFLANMSHEIRTPMNAIIGFGELALMDMSPADASRQHVMTILNSGKSLLRIIDDILDFSKIEAGKLSLEKVAFHLPNMMWDTLKVLEFRAAEKSLDLRLNLDPQLPSVVEGDPTRLRQVLLNLVGNAIKFTHQGSINVSVMRTADPSILMFTVKDTGIGMEPEQAERIFDSFSQADASITRRYGGTGLGTTISKQFVELMGGDISVQTEVGVGSTFSFTVELNEAAKDQDFLYNTDLNHGINAELSSPRTFSILLADDIEENATLVQLRLSKIGHTIKWAKNGQEAVELYHKGDFDLILMDVQMPVMDGITATRHIRQLEKVQGKHTPIIALTASITVEDRDVCIEAGMDAVEGKPIDFKTLLRAMESVVPPERGVTTLSSIEMNDQGKAIDFTPILSLVDLEQALETWHDPEVYARSLKSFAAKRANDGRLIQQLLHEHPDDVESARTVAHALKGLAGNLALVEVERIASRIDSALKGGDLSTVVTLLSSLSVALEEANKAVERLELPSADAARDFGVSIDTGELAVLLKRAKAALEELNPDAVQPILDELARSVPRDQLTPLLQAIDGFDFDAANSALSKLAEEYDVEV